jgi:hypothetical protein
MSSTKRGLKCLKCGNVIASYHRHDYKECSCGGCFVDGGDDYFRYGGSDFQVVESPRRMIPAILLYDTKKDCLCVVVLDTLYYFDKEELVEDFSYDDLTNFVVVDEFYNIDESWRVVCA